MQVTYCAGCVSANSKPHCLCWGDWEMGTTINVQNAATFIQKVDRSSSKDFLFVQLSFA